MTDYVILVATFILGTVIGSFVYCTASRLALRKKITGRSVCENCDKRLSIIEMIPLVSFLLQKGKCRSCHSRLSINYLLSELGVGVLFAFLYWTNPLSDLVHFMVFYTFVTFILLISFEDMFAMKVSIKLLIFFAIYSLLYAIFLQAVPQSFVTVLICLLFYMMLYYGTRKKGVGMGDIIFFASCSFILSVPAFIVALVIAYIGGTLILSPFILLRKVTPAHRIAFTPFIAVGVIGSLLYSEQIIYFYLEVFSPFIANAIVL